MLGFILVLMLIGLIAGAIARLLVPGRDPLGILGTMAIGIIGSFVGGFLADVLFRDNTTDRGLHPTGLFGSILGSVVVLLVMRAVTGRRRARIW